MFDKSIDLNLKLAFPEFGRAMWILGIGLFLSGVVSGRMLIFGSMNKILLIIALVATFGGSMTFLAAGFHKLYYKSIFGEGSYFSMSFPISNLMIILTKVIVGAFWISLFLVIFFGFLCLYGGASNNVMQELVGILMIQGVPKGQVGPGIALMIWRVIFGAASSCATLLMTVIAVNVLNVQRFRLATNIGATAAIFAVLYGLQRGYGKITEQFFDPMKNMVATAGAEMFFLLLLIATQIYISKKLLDKRYSLT